MRSCRGIEPKNPWIPETRKNDEKKTKKSHPELAFPQKSENGPQIINFVFFRYSFRIFGGQFGVGDFVIFLFRIFGIQGFLGSAPPPQDRNSKSILVSPRKVRYAKLVGLSGILCAFFWASLMKAATCCNLGQNWLWIAQCLSTVWPVFPVSVFQLRGDGTVLGRPPPLRTTLNTAWSRTRSRTRTLRQWISHERRSWGGVARDPHPKLTVQILPQHASLQMKWRCLKACCIGPIAGRNSHRIFFFCSEIAAWNRKSLANFPLHP